MRPKKRNEEQQKNADPLALTMSERVFVGFVMLCPKLIRSFTLTRLARSTERSNRLIATIRQRERGDA